MSILRWSWEPYVSLLHWFHANKGSGHFPFYSVTILLRSRTGRAPLTLPPETVPALRLDSDRGLVPGSEGGRSTAEGFPRRGLGVQNNRHG